jgi:hypothetical protein
MHNTPRRKSLCDLLRNTSAAFVQQTATDPQEDARLRSEIDCLLALYDAGEIDPVRAFMDRSSSAGAPAGGSEYVPLH